MNIHIEDDALTEILEYGRTNEKKYRKLPKEAIKGFVKTVNRLRAASRIEDLFRIKSLNYEALHGDLEGLESVRCTLTWRLIFRSYPKEDSIVITEISLIELSHHYD